MYYGYIGKKELYCVAEGVEPPKGSIPCLEKPVGEYVLSDNGEWIPDRETLEIEARRMRNERLFECDWTQVSDAPLSVAEKGLWAIYRQALRDISGQANFPFEILWPEKPQGERE